MGLFERRRPVGPQPFAGSELLREVLDEGDWNETCLPETSGASQEPQLDARERLFVHVVGFIIGAMNLFFVNWSHPSRGWWFWIPLVVWLGLLAAHGSWVVLARRRSGVGSS